MVTKAKSKPKTRSNGHKANGAKGLAAFRSQRVNANKHKPLGLKLVSESIQRDGYSAPMVAAADGELFIGSLRHEAVSDVLPAEPIIVKSRGDRPIIHIREDIPNADDPRARRLGVADNALAHMDYNPDGEILAALAAEDATLKSIIEADDLSLRAVQEFAAREPLDAEPQMDRAEELRKKWKVKTGQLWALGDHRLVCGDCTDRAVVERVMDGEKAGCTITDPPYNVGFNYDGETVNDKKDETEYSEFSKLWFSECQIVSLRQIVTPGGVNLKMWLSVFDVLHIGAWVKNNDTGGAHGVVSMFQCWEPVLFLESKESTNRRKLDFTAWLIGTGVTAKQIDTATNSNMGGHYLSDKSQPAIPTVEMFDRFRHLVGDPPEDIYNLIINRRDDGFGRIRHSDVFYFDPAVSTKEHPCPKPLKMWADLVENYSEPDAIIFDCFAGSGTTLIACENLNRRCRAIEISPVYCAVTLQRYQDATGKTPELLD